jgi:type I restriction enzyme S subunit
MNAARLLQHFDQISDAADAVPRLRRFVYEIAICGKLTSQDSSDESATVLLRNRLLAYRGPIPAGWAWSSLGRLGPVVGGGTPTKTIASYWQGDIPWVTPKDMKVDVIEDAIDHISEQGLEASTAKLIPPGSLLMVVRGMILAHSFPTAVTAKSVTINQDMKALVPFCPEMFSYLALMAKGISRGVLGLVKRSTHGTCKLLTDELFEYPVAIPPLAEQQRIVAKVDELMALCDRLEAAQAEREARRDRLVAASLARVSQPAADAGSDARAAGFHLDQFARLTTRPEHVKHLRQTILNLAVRGRLVPQDPQNQSATPRSTSSIPEYTLPPSWSCHALAMLLNGDSQNGYSKKPDEAPDGFPILRISAGTTRTDGIVNEEEYKLISGITDAVQNQYSILPGDLLACRFNGNKRFVGRFTLFQGYSGKSFIYPDKLIRLRVNQAMVLPDLLRHFGESDLVKAEVEAFCATTVGNWGISATNLKLVRFPLPPLAEQRRIVAKVDELMALCDQLEASLAAAATDRARLLESLLHEALAPAA